jgi:hypothetical protein
VPRSSILRNQIDLIEQDRQVWHETWSPRR